MGCSVTISTEERLIDNYFSTLPIRHVSPKIVGDYIQHVIQEYPSDYYLQNKAIVNKFLSNHEYKNDKDMFDDIFSECMDNIDVENTIFKYPYLLIVYIILAQKNSEQAYEVGLMISKNFKINSNGDLIDKNTLKQIIKLYIVIITKYSVDYIKQQSTNKIRFEDLKQKGFKDSAINLYVENYLLTHITSNNISLYKFFYKDYDELTYDSIIRSKIVRLSIQHTENNMKRNSTFLIDENYNETSRSKKNALTKEEKYDYSYNTDFNDHNELQEENNHEIETKERVK